ncbi:hypothetical protein L6164_023665 [Bauhinia variegata]|uniref:Uncharacterized protein n=1 Tax=Bauhinia variegata TaxID=167791 RepID=A0ACB9MKB9_BAUVA|nr:hypothetical protein L6164_023665 [Bauhinia variegata]
MQRASKEVVDSTYSFQCWDFFPSLSWLDVITGLVGELNTTFRELDTFFDAVIADHKKVEREDVNSDKKHFVDILLQLQESGNINFELTQKPSSVSYWSDMFVAGTDTSSTTLEWVFAELLKNPILLKKVQEEVRRVVGNKSQVHEDEVNQMKYLRCVIKTRVLVNIWAIQTDPKLWNRPLEFLPERFENSEIDYKGQHFQFTPFGIGRRGCPGLSYGIVSVECMLANFLYLFDWKLPKSGDLDMSEKHGRRKYHFMSKQFLTRLDLTLRCGFTSF